MESRGGEAVNSARLILILSTASESRIVELWERSITVGRGEDADVVLADASLSGRHVRFQRNGDGVSVEDLGSDSGTVMNGKRLDRAEMRSGDVAVLGNVVVCLQLAPSRHAAILGLSSFEAIRGRVENELVRARTFARPLSMVFFRSERALGGGAFVPSLTSRLRCSDLAGLYDAGSLLVLLPETDTAAAAAIAKDLVSATPDANVVAGVASCTASTVTPDQLLASAMAAAALTSAEERIALAPASPADGGAAIAQASGEENPAPRAAETEGEPLPEVGIDLRTELQRHEAGLIMRALRKTNGHQRRAAALLRLPLRTFERKLKDLGLNRAALS